MSYIEFNGLTEQCCTSAQFLVCLLSLSDAKHRPEALSSDVGGIRNATSGSATDKLTREHRMTLDEAHLILNTKRGEAMENILKASGYPHSQTRWSS